MGLPETITDTQQLDNLLSEPSPRVIETMAKIPGDILVLGAAGKMGPTLTRMAQRASEMAGDSRKVIAVSRFSSPTSREYFHQHNIETIPCDLLNPAQVAELPDAPNIVYMAGMKFGSTGQEALTWAMNAWLPSNVCQKFRNSRIVAFSTGNVYGETPVTRGGSIETDPPNPVGEYAMSCLGRERIFEYFSRTYHIPTVLLRLNYAVEMRYGVPVDIARKVWNGETINLHMGMANVIWQGDANSIALCSLSQATSPPFLLNVAGPEQVSVRQMASYFADRMQKNVTFEGEESDHALLNNGQLGHRLYGYPQIALQQMLDWIADWIMRGGESLNKPTHFEAKDGKF